MFEKKTENNPFARIYNYRKILFSTTFNAIRADYSGSILGLAWTVAGPIILITLYILIYAVVFRIRPINMTTTEYIMYVVSGLIAFLGFSISLGAGTVSISGNKHFLLNTVFPAELVPIRTVIASNMTLFWGIIVITVSTFIVGTASFYLLLLPLVIFFQLLFTIGVIWVFSLVNLVFRDVQFMIQYIVIILLILTPISYTPDMMPGTIKLIAYINPLFYFTYCYQSLIVFGQVPSLWILLTGMTISIATFWLGYWFFLKAKAVVFDYA